MMEVQVTEQGGQAFLELREPPALYRFSVTSHGLRDLEFVLAQHRAMSRHCPEARDEHSCANPPGHGGTHLCRACDVQWQVL